MLSIKLDFVSGKRKAYRVFFIKGEVISEFSKKMD